jgi:L-amino acid N-acyltransferase YncA
MRTIRPATPSDAAACLAIYAPYVESTTVSFETIVPTLEEFAARIEKVQAGWCWLVAEQAGEILGYAYGSMHRERPAYKWSTEVSAYVNPAFHRQGVATALYAQLLSRLAEMGYHQAFAGIALPNVSSIAMHKSLGFTDIGVFKSVGRKFDAWHDVAWLQRAL